MKRNIAFFLVLIISLLLFSCGFRESVESSTESPTMALTINEPLYTESVETVPKVTPDTPDTVLNEDPAAVDWKSLLDFTDPVPSEDNPEKRMSHNIYSDPDLSKTSGNYSGFLIDFKADYDSLCTYWALCNWGMDTGSLSKQYCVTDNGGAYAGLQSNEDGKMAIMSFGEIHYLDENEKDTILRAQRVYPQTDYTNTFGGEGEGTNYITEYNWKAGRWYRMYLNCYDDAETSHTFVEQWIEDIDKKEWTKISCFDTGLSESFFTGDMSQFMENYWYSYSNELRSFEYRNIYVREYDSGEWKPVPGSWLSVDTWWDNKKGSFAFGSDGYKLFGITCGYGPDIAGLNEDIKEYYQLTPTDKVCLP